MQHRHGQAFCARCYQPLVQAGEGELLNAPIGPVAKSVAVYLRYRMGLPYRKTAELFREVFGLKFVPASALGFDRKAAARGAPLYEDLGQKIRASEVVHADETSWRNDGLAHFVWFAGNEHLAFFHIDRHRSAEVAQALFGEDFDGTLVRDRYAAYNGIGYRIKNPQHPSQFGPNRQKSGRPAKGIPPNPPDSRYGYGSGGPV